jgi:CMP/dCMP kinase
MIIAVDGPAASGKGTIAAALAEHFALPFLDTGLLYRAVGLSVLQQQGDPNLDSDAVKACHFEDTILADPLLRSEAVGQAASKVSAHPAVRAALIERQRAFAAQPDGAVLDGRDIGTVIAPHADAKLYVTASAEVRAARRQAEEPMSSYHAILADIKERDARDAGRDAAPLRQAEDAALLDTSNLTIASAVQQAIALVEAQLSRRR